MNGKLLNLGCGQRFHSEWINLDFESTNKNIIAHNLLKGIPFKDKEFDAVYHSHVLEHFTKDDANSFLIECFRVLKKKGVIRIAVPDLEKIIKEYSKNLELAINGDIEAQKNYEWIMLEMYDQTIRNKSGGDMAKYLYQEILPNEDYVYSRIGEEGRNLRETFFKKKEINSIRNHSSENILKMIFRPLKNLIRILLFKEESIYSSDHSSAYQIGKFHLSGEIHQWMYDRYSLKKLLTEIGFVNFKIKTAFESSIPEWNSYELESKNGLIFKPDSLFIEAYKL